MISTVLAVLAVISSLGLILATGLAAVSRQRKSEAGDRQLTGLMALVEAKLDPEGSVLVEGELWRACSRNQTVIESGRRVLVVGLRDHLLLVEPLD